MQRGKYISGKARRATDAAAGQPNAVAIPINARPATAPVIPSLLLMKYAPNPVAIATNGKIRAVPIRSIKNPAGICTSAYAIRNELEMIAVCNVFK